MRTGCDVSNDAAEEFEERGLGRGWPGFVGDFNQSGKFPAAFIYSFLTLFMLNLKKPY